MQIMAWFTNGLVHQWPTLPLYVNSPPPKKKGSSGWLSKIRLWKRVGKKVSFAKNR